MSALCTGQHARLRQQLTASRWTVAYGPAGALIGPVAASEVAPAGRQHSYGVQRGGAPRRVQEPPNCSAASAAAHAGGSRHCAAAISIRRDAAAGAAVGAVAACSQLRAPPPTPRVPRSICSSSSSSTSRRGTTLSLSSAFTSFERAWHLRSYCRASSASPASTGSVASNASGISDSARGPWYDKYRPLPGTANGEDHASASSAGDGSLGGSNSTRSTAEASAGLAGTAAAAPASPPPPAVRPAPASWPPNNNTGGSSSTSSESAVRSSTSSSSSSSGGDMVQERDPFLMGLQAVAAAAAAKPGGGGAAAAAGSDAKAAPSVDVTRHNFEAMLPVVRAYLDAADYVAFDCEMTGLFLEGANDNYLDDMQDRYTRTAAAAHAFVINQFGMSCFKRQPALGPGGERKYLAASFNFYLFPRPPEGGNASASGPSKRFLCDAGSLAFLANQGFDFNKCIYDGVPFMPVRQRDDMLRQVERDNGGGGGGGLGAERGSSAADVELSKPEDAAFVAGLLDTVRAWLAEADSPSLDLPSVNRYLRLLSYQALARPASFGGPPGGAPGWHPGFFVSKVYDARGNTVIRLLRCASAAAGAELEAAARAAKRAEVQAAAGFAAVWEALRECGRPVVGHNCMFDVAYGVAQFGEGRLPATWEGFKAAASAWLPGGVYDTKHVCRQLGELVGGDTTLGLMYGTLVPQPGAPPGSGPGGRLPARVCVEHAPGFEKYVAVGAGQLAHEAGYDAYMTGALFAALEAVLADGKAAPPTAAAPYASIVPFANRLNVTRSDLPYALLRPAAPGDPATAEPVPQRPTVFHLGALAPGVRAAEIHRACEGAGLGKVRITFLPGNSALLELGGAEAAEAAAAGALDRLGLCSEVLPYAAYRARKDAMLAAGTWPLPGYGSLRAPYGGGGGGGGSAPPTPVGAAGGSAPVTPGGGAAAAAAAAGRPAKRRRVADGEEAEAEARTAAVDAEAEAARHKWGRQCSIM